MITMRKTDGVIVEVEDKDLQKFLKKGWTILQYINPSLEKHIEMQNKIEMNNTSLSSDDAIVIEEKGKTFSDDDSQKIKFDKKFDNQTIKEVQEKCLLVALDTIERIIQKDLNFPELIRAMSDKEIKRGDKEGGGHGLFIYPDKVAINPHYSKNFNFMCGNALHEYLHYGLITMVVPEGREVFWHEGIADLLSEIIAKRISKELYVIFVKSNEMRQEEYQKNQDVDIYKQRAIGYNLCKILDKKGCLIKVIRYCIKNSQNIEDIVVKYCNISQKEMDNFFDTGHF